MAANGSIHWWIIVGCIPYSAASSDTVRSPFTISSATRALNQRHGSWVSSCPDLLVLGDQQMSDRSFRHCPIFGE
jgi:hypothetical protein